MNRRRMFLAISVLAFLGAGGALLRGQYLAWEAARLEFASEHAEAPLIDAERKQGDGWLLESPTEEFDAAVKQNAAGHFRTMAALLAVTGLAAGYWGWVKCRPQPAATADGSQKPI